MADRESLEPIVTLVLSLSEAEQMQRVLDTTVKATRLLVNRSPDDSEAKMQRRIDSATRLDRVRAKVKRAIGAAEQAAELVRGSRRGR